MYEIKESIKNMNKQISNLEIISWEEVFEHVPDSKELERDVINAIEELKDCIDQLKYHFN
jgi:hypothetical protein